jgi:hypothetical protein
VLQQQGSAQHRAAPQQEAVGPNAPSSSLQQQQPTQPLQQQQQQQQQPKQQQESQPPPQAPSTKRVGFSIDGLGPAEDAGGQHNFSGVSRRKQEQLQKEQQ